MWHTEFETRTGAYHRRKGMACQDQVINKKRGGYQCIVLADGTGSTDSKDANILCVKEVINQTADKMLDIISNPAVLHLSKETIIRTVMHENVHIISRYMELYHLPAGEWGSTLIGAAINTKTGEYLMLHLGDGIIIGRSNTMVRVYSYPVNGTADETCLTISRNIVDNTKVFRGFLGEIKDIVICSDGLYDFPVDNSFINNRLWDMVKGQPLLDREDDQGYIRLTNGGSANDDMECRYT